MDTEIKSGVSRFHGCPESLKPAMIAWMCGTLSSSELVIASYYAALDFLSSYEWKLLPTPPEEVQAYRRLDWADRRQWTEEDIRKLRSRFGGFYTQEAEIESLNASNQWWLKEIRTHGTWTPPVVNQIEQAIRTHENRGAVYV